MPIESPCVRNCTLDEADVCLGCGRTITEICEWAAASDDRKHAILALLPERIRVRKRW